jgi:hypothetical protein
VCKQEICFLRVVIHLANWESNSFFFNLVFIYVCNLKRCNDTYPWGRLAVFSGEICPVSNSPVKLFFFYFLEDEKLCKKN